MSVIYVTGTDTGVGKTISVAAMAVVLGGSVAVYKPTQAGLENGFSDGDVARRLAGVASVSEGIRLRHPMAPVAAAEREGVTLPTFRRHRARIAELAAHHDHVLVEGAGGLLVDIDGHGSTMADFDGEFVIVCRPALGTLNHTALTLEALAARDRRVRGLIIGSWPAQPSEVEQSNWTELARMAPLLGVIPAGVGDLDPASFRAAAPAWLTGFEV